MLQYPLSVVVRNVNKEVHNLNIHLISEYGSANNVIENVYIPIIIGAMAGLPTPDFMVEFAYNMIKQYKESIRRKETNLC